MGDEESTPLLRESPTPVSKWARIQRELLRIERDEEKAQVADTIAQLSAQECMERGISLVPLVIKGVTTGLYGRASVSVGALKNRPLPAHRFGAGDQVRLHSTKGSKGTGEEYPTEILGVVGKVTELTVEVVCDDVDDADGLRPPLRLDVVASDATYKKLIAGLDALEKYPGGGPSERIINVLFGLEPPFLVGSAPTVPPLQAPTAAVTRLNESQREAVAFALATRDVALIHGPPGTGKTTTVVGVVWEALARGWRCLVCAPSNVAVDGILERFVASDDSNSAGGSGRKRQGPRIVRLGHPARLLPQILENSLDALVSRHEGTTILRDVRGEIDALMSQLYGNLDAIGASKAKNRSRAGDRKGAKREVKALRKEARVREEKVVREVMKSREVVFATCVGAAASSLRDEVFDLVIIDEAAQALEAACWIPILKGSRLVLAGDHKQLPPTVKSQKAAAGLRDGGGSGGAEGREGLGFTMFDRILLDHGQEVCRMLDVQYRMNEDICSWASREAEDMAATVMLLIDTTGCDMLEEEAGGGSRRNEREAEVTVQHVKNLLKAGVPEEDVAVISPYNGQVNLLKRLLRPQHPGVEVRSVDGFQGGEKEAVVLSLVRSNPGKSIGFLADARRLNVAVTRAKRHVAVICDAECCGSDAFIARLIQHIEDRGEYRSALEIVSARDVTAVAVERQKEENPGPSGKGTADDVVGRLKATLPAVASTERDTGLAVDDGILSVNIVDTSGATATGFLALCGKTEDSYGDEAASSDILMKTAAVDRKDANTTRARREIPEFSQDPETGAEAQGAAAPEWLESIGDDPGDASTASTAYGKKVTTSENGLLPSSNLLLRSLHAERATRRPPPPPAQAKKDKEEGKFALVIPGNDRDRGFPIEFEPPRGSSGGGFSKNQTSTRKGGSAMKGKKKKRGGGGGGEAGGSRGGKADSVRPPAEAAGGGVESVDDDLAFLDAQIKAQRASEPCYAALLRSTTEVMRANNPAWAKAEDKGKPADSRITKARRGQLQNALQTRLEEEGKRRSKANGKKEER